MVFITKLLLFMYMKQCKCLQLNRRKLTTLSKAIVPSIFITSQAKADALPWALSDLYKNLKDKNVEKAVFSNDGSKINVLDNEGFRHEVSILPSDVSSIESILRDTNVRFGVLNDDARGIESVLSIFGNVIIPFGILFVLFAMVRGSSGMGPNGPNGINSFFQGKTPVDMEPNTGVTFDDVAGCDESKMELKEVVDFEISRKLCKHRRNIPQRCSFGRSTRHGKNSLARAVAGEAGVPFISTTGSAFVEVFVGVGASRVRKIFEDAKKNAPCIVFIDEIDSIGKSRSGGNSPGSNDEREQTLNQILAEMDGFEGNTGVIVLAATNRADILDTALLRPGRFDRRVPVNLPSKYGRVEILKVHSRNKALSDSVDLENIADQTIGFSGSITSKFTKRSSYNSCAQ